jgi:hypothetical protein
MKLRIFTTISMLAFIVYSFTIAPLAYTQAGNTQIVETSAGTSVEIDPRCHTRAQCVNARQAIGVRGGDIDDFFISTTESETACAALSEQEGGADVGFCLASGEATTVTTFFGKNNFSSIGELIKYIYSISTGIAATLAVIMIIVAGIQIMTAGGNSSTVGAAKKRIGAAIAGLVLLGTAYIILRTINPALVELQQPQVFMINQEIVTPIEADEEQLCDPDGTGPFGGCPANEYCMNKTELNLEESFDGPCDWVTVAAATVPAIIAGGITAFPTFSALLQASVVAGKSKTISYFANIAGQRTLIAKLATFGGSAISATRQGVTYAGGAVVLYGINEITGATDLVTNAIDRFTSARGICQPKGNGLQAGDICSTDPNAGISCGPGLTCIPDARLQGAQSCWGPSAMGFCSSGENGAICRDTNDCDEGYWCQEKDWGGAIGVRKSCSNGTEGAYCDPDRVNQDRDACAAGFSCINGICVGEQFQATSEFDVCTSNAACSEVQGQYNTYECWTSNDYCQFLELQNELGNRKGVCLGSASTGIQEGRGRCDNDEYQTEDGTCLSRSNLFYRAARLAGNAGYAGGFAPYGVWQRTSCRSNIKFSDDGFDTFVTELERRGYTFN